MCQHLFFFWIEKKNKQNKILLYKYMLQVIMSCITLWKKKTKQFLQQSCVYLCDWVYVYIHMDIYINADDDDILGHFLFWSAVFLFCFLKGNNTFDGKIIVTWFKKLHGCAVIWLSRS